MFHLAAFTVSLGNTADTDTPAVTDSCLLIQNSHFVPQIDVQVLFAYCTAVTLLRGKIVTPTLRQFSPPFIRPIDASATPSTRTPIADYRTNPLTLKALEEIAIQLTDSAAGPNQAFALLGLQTGGYQAAPAGQIITMRGTGTTTLVANGWTQVAMTWADNLPSGTYACVGLSGFSAGAIAARLIFDQQFWRPGAIIGINGTIIPHPMFLKGGLGTMGTFTANRMPNVEFLSSSADTSEEVYLDLVRVA